MVPHFKGTEYASRLLLVGAGMFGVGAVSITIMVASIYLGYQKMTFFILLFLSPVILAASSLGDSKRRPFARRLAELIGANILKQVAAVCIVLFVSYAMSSLFSDVAFLDIPWTMKPFGALLFFLALVFMAIPIKNLTKGAVKGDTSVIDKEATRPQRTAKTVGKGVAIVGGVAATGGILAAVGGAGAAAGGAGAAAKTAGAAGKMGKVGSALGQGARALGPGSKAGRAMRFTGQVAKGGEGVLNAKASSDGRKSALRQLGTSLIENPKTAGKYHDENGQLLPNAHKMAQKDAKRISESGQARQRAQRAQDEQLAQFFGGYKAATGEESHLDPEHPDNKRQRQLDRERERREMKDAADHDMASAYGGGGYGQPGPGPKDSGGNPPGGAYPHEREQFREQALNNLTEPAFMQDVHYAATGRTQGADVLDAVGVSRAQAVQDPSVLFTSQAYGSDSTARMDPFHPSAGALNDLRFAASAGDQDQLQEALGRASEAIRDHGVPDYVSSVHSIGDKADQFSSASVLGAIPNITPETSLSERAGAARAMMGAQAAMPADHPAREVVGDYTDALADPSADSATLDAARLAAVHEVASVMRESPGVKDSQTPVSAAPGGSDGGMSRSEMRQAVADGVTDAYYRGPQPAGDNASNNGGDAPIFGAPSADGPPVYRERSKRRRSGLLDQLAQDEPDSWDEWDEQ